MIKEVPSHGAQRDSVTSDVSLQLFETAGEPLCPSIAEVAEMAASVVRRIMLRGSDKSGFGQWFHTDSRRYNADRCVNHICQAMMQLDGNKKSPDANGEEATDHLERALVRAAFLLFKTKKGMIQ
jgi:hypothetical protein